MFNRYTLPLILFFISISIGVSYQYFFSHLKVFEVADLKMTDMLFEYRSSKSDISSTLDDIIVIEVDDESYRRLDRKWPWTRDVFAVFFENLSAYEPSAVGFDFALVGRSDDARIDKWLAETIALNPGLVLASYFGPNGAYVEPLARFRKAAFTHAYVDKPLDSDGVTRKHVPITHLQDGDSAYSFGTTVAFASKGLQPKGLIEDEGAYIEYQLAKSDDSEGLKSFRSEKTSNGTNWISMRYRPENFNYIPIWQVIAKVVPADKIKGKIAFVGVSSPIFHDIHQTPLGAMPGIYINANEAIAVLDQDGLHPIDDNLKLALLIILGLIFVFIVNRIHFLMQLALFFIIEIGLYGISLWLFVSKGILYEPFSPMIVVLLNYAMTLLVKSLNTLIENAALQKQVITDSKTGLYGHKYFVVKLATVFQSAQQHKKEFCVAMLDIDHFKNVNDTHGHDVGDDVIIAVSKVIKQHIRRLDVGARFGGEEFCLILMDTGVKGGQECLERMRKAIQAQEFESEKGKFKVTMSSGLVLNRHPDAKTSNDLVKLADKALYNAKEGGRNRVCVNEFDE